ncbi:type II toxin-antitoxin system VapB family antitoxin, partial [Pseudactinotalea sp.]|uniref:type II toxin-antitoxin system VapB family antitoxin n=1 Tax=Pseudactinotalea sp. TaxID=1926260 RepID=UPI003B3A3B5C
MGLNIKNERVHALAREAAAITGKSQTGAIEEALQRLLASYGADPEASRRAVKIDLAYDVARRYRAIQIEGDPALATVEDLYDSST